MGLICKEGFKERRRNRIETNLEVERNESEDKAFKVLHQIVEAAQTLGVPVASEQ